MTQAYRTLQADLPERTAAEGSGFPSDARRVKAWVEALPRANQAATLRQVGDALQAVAAQRLDGTARLGVLEQLRPVVLDGVALLERQLQGLSFPLPPAKAQIASEADGLHAALATGYRQAVVELCAPSGSVPFLRGGAVAQAIERGLYHASRRLMLSYALYGEPEAGVWATLNRLFAFARDAGVDDKSVEDVAVAGAVSPSDVYVQAALLALSNPYRFTQREQVELGALARELAPYVSLSDRAGGQPFALPLDADRGPGYTPDERSGDASGGRVLWLGVDTLARDIDAALGTQTTGEVLMRFGRGRSVVAPADTLRRLRGGWGQPAARGHTRLDAGHALEVVVGLSALHHHIAGVQDFDLGARRGAAAASDGVAWGAGEAASRAPIAARVLDQSLGGYRLRWGGDARARVGELLGLSIGGDEEGRDWMVGVVRWLRYDRDGAVDAGVELLARRALPVGLRPLPRGSGSGEVLRGAMLDALIRPGRDDDLRLLAPSAFGARAAEVEVMRASDPDSFDPSPLETSRHAVKEIIDSAGDFLIVAARADDAQEPA